MYKKRILKLVSVFLLIMMMVSNNISIDINSGNLVKSDGKAYAASGATTVYFLENTQRSRNQTITIPNLHSITGISVNTGDVSYSVNGDNVTVYVSNGSSSSSYTPSQYVTDSLTSSTDSFQYSIYYNSGGYSGYIYKSGNVTATVISGTPADTKFVSGMYSAINTVTTTDWTNPLETVSVSDSNPIGSGDYYYSDSYGYSGYIPRTGTDDGCGNSDHGVYHYGTPVNGRTPWTRHRYFRAVYSGNVYKPDTRVWSYTQYYAGTVYGSTTYYYSYNVSIDYQTHDAPIVSVLSPSDNQIFSETDTAFAPSVSVSDGNNDTLTCKYFIDSESTPRETKSVSAPWLPKL